jgi:hypothetical protein
MKSGEIDILNLVRAEALVDNLPDNLVTSCHLESSPVTGATL